MRGAGGDVIEGEGGVVDSLLHEGPDTLGVITTRDLGNNSAVFAVDVDLR